MMTRIPLTSLRVKKGLSLHLLLILTLSSLATNARPAFGDDSAKDSCRVVLETLAPGAALDKAGFRAGDLILSWSTASSDASYKVCSPFEWLWLEAEIAPREELNLRVEREGNIHVLPIGPGAWRSTVHPFVRERLAELHSKARAAFEEGSFREAAILWSELHEQARSEGHQQAASWAQVMEAQAWYKEQDLAKASTRFEAAISQSLQVGDLRAQVNSWYTFAEFKKSLNQVDEALTSYESTLLALKRLHNDHRLFRAWVLFKMASLAWLKRDLHIAHELSSEARQLYAELAPDSLQFAAVLTMSANILDDKGYPLEAEKLYKQALPIAEAKGSLEHQAANFNNLGAVAFGQGDFVEATHYFNRVLSILSRIPKERSQLATAYANLASLYHAQWRLDEAELYFGKSSEILEDLSEPLLTSTVTMNRGRTALDRGELATAEELCKQSLALRESLASGSLLTGSPLDCLASVYLKKGELHKALDSAERALKVAIIHAPNSLMHADYLYRAAGVLLTQDRLSDADSHFRQARSIYEKLAPNSEFHADCLHQLALIRIRSGHESEALDLFERAIATLESQIAKGHNSEVDRGAHRSRSASIYVNYIQQLASSGNSEKAFHVLERWRAGAFLAMLGERDIVFSDVPIDLEHERRRIAHEYDLALQELASVSHSGNIEGAQSKLVSLRAQHEQLMRNVRSASPRLGALRYPQPLDFPATQRALDADEILLSFVLYPDMSLLFVITPQGPLRTIRLGAGEADVRRDIEVLLNMLSQHRLPIWRQHTLRTLYRRLYRKLLEPVAKYIEGSARLVIIPDGPLHSLPWGALFSEFPDSPDQSHHLSSWKSFNIVLSATVYNELKKSRRVSHPRFYSPGQTVAAFGDPVYPDSSAQIRAEPTNVEQARLYDLVRSGLRLDRLPGSRREVERIAALFPGAVRAYLAKEATEEQAKNLPRNTRIVHFATHTRIDRKSPLDSAVALTFPEKLVEGRDNGLLQAWEILERVRVDADLVVLSACDSGLGTEMGGEGLIGLTRAFQYAGARSVLASLWKISDRTTAEFMVRFYRHLKEGLSKDEALRATQMEFIRGPIQVTNDKGELVDFDASPPYYWAAFQIYGDWQ